MAGVLIEGFESNTLDVFNHTRPGGGAAIKTGAGGSGNAGDWSDFHFEGGTSDGKILIPGGPTEIFGAIRWVPVATRQCLYIQDQNAVSIFSIKCDGSLHVTAYDINGLLATGSTVMTSAYHLIEFRMKIGNAGTGIIQIRLDGYVVNEISNTTTADTDNGGSSGCWIVGLGSGTSGGEFDDLVIYDTTDSPINNSWVGDVGVAGFVVNAQGASEQWNPPVATGTRFYFTDGAPDGVAYIGPANSSGYGTPMTAIAIDALWNVDGYANAVKYKGTLLPWKAGTAVVDKQSGSTITAASSDDVLLGQYISTGLAAQTITGTIKMQMQVQEGATSWDARSQLVVRVVSQDGTTVRGTLYAGDTGAMTDEWSTTSRTNTTFPQATISPVAISSLAINEGDRIVVEFGYRTGAGHAADDFRFRLGDSGSTGDLPAEGDTTTSSAYNPWIEFSNAITLSDNTNWELVDEIPYDGTATLEGTYVATSTNDDTDLYGMSDIDGTLIAAGPVAIKTFSRKQDPGARTLTHVYATSGGTQPATEHPALTTYSMQMSVINKDATDAAAWSALKINQLQIGIKATT